MNETIKEILKQLQEASTDSRCIDIDKAISYYNAIYDLQKQNENLEKETKNLHTKIDISMGILKTWKDFCEVSRKNCIDIDKAHWTYCIEKLEFLEEVLKGSVVDE